MTSLYVANTTKQIQIVYYRRPAKVDENGKQLWGQLFRETIAPNRQMKMPGDFTPAEAAIIFDHQARHYGAVRDRPGIMERHADGRPKFVGLIWSQSPIKTDSIDEAIKTNLEAAEARSDKMLDATAKAMLDNQSELSQEHDLPVPATATVEIVPEPIKGGPVSQAKGAEAFQPGVQPRHQDTRTRARA